MRRRLTQVPFLIARAGFPRLAVAAQQLLCFVRRKPGTWKSLYFLKACAHLHRLNYLKKAQAYPIFLINRECDRARLNHFKTQSKRLGFRFERIEAVNCAAADFDYGPFQQCIGQSFGGKELFLRGAVGCFLSHLEVWRRIAKGNDSFAMVCEDDARVLGPLPRCPEDLDLPPDADIVFVNARLVFGALNNESDRGLRDRNFLFLDFREALFRFDIDSNPISGPGADGYILTRQGAVKLLALFEETKVSMEVDWFLLFHSLESEATAEFLRRDATGRFNSLCLAPGRLRSYTMIPALVEQASMGTSIGFNNPASYIHRDEIFGNRQA